MAAREDLENMEVVAYIKRKGKGNEAILEGNSNVRRRQEFAHDRHGESAGGEFNGLPCAER